MAAIDGAITDANLLNENQKKIIGRQKWQLLGKLAAKDPVELGFHRFLDVPEVGQCAARELAYWEKIIVDDEIHPQPIAQAALRWLKANMPAPAQKVSIVHGDYRTGNILFVPVEDI